MKHDFRRKIFSHAKLVQRHNKGIPSWPMLPFPNVQEQTKQA